MAESDGAFLDRQPFQGTEGMPKLMVARHGALSPPSPQNSGGFSTVVSFIDVVPGSPGSVRSSGSNSKSSSLLDPSSPTSHWEFSIHDREQRHGLLSHAMEISQALRPEGTRSRMVPVLEMLCAFDDCGVPIAQMLPELLVAVGGYGSVACLRGLISNLCLHADPAVTTETAEALRCLMLKQDAARDDDGGRMLRSMVQDMCQSSWSAPRSVGASLVSELYRVAAEKEKESLRSLFSAFCVDEDVFVRRAAAGSLLHWTHLVCSSNEDGAEPPAASREPASPLLLHPSAQRRPSPLRCDHRLFETFIMPLVTQFSGDDRHDTLRIALVRQMVEMSTVLPPALAKKYLSPVAVKLCTDTSWRVRFVIAKSMTDVFSRVILARAAAEGEEGDPVGLLASAFFRDEEVEVRAAAASQLHGVSLLFPDAVIDSIFIPIAVECCKDLCAQVRCSVARSVASLAMHRASTTAGPRPAADVMAVRLTAVLIDLMGDSNEQVEVQAIRSVPLLPRAAWDDGSETFRQVSACLERAATSTKWRIRESVASILADICANIAPDSFDNGFGGKVLLQFLSDPVASLRATTVSALGRIGHVYGAGWAAKTLLALVGDDGMTTSASGSCSVAPAASSVVTRSSCIMVIEALLPVIENKQRLDGDPTDRLPQSAAAAAASSLRKDEKDAAVEARVASVVTLLSNDAVSNVRLVVARALTSLQLFRCRIALQARQAALAKLSQDGNADVRNATQTVDEPF